MEVKYVFGSAEWFDELGKRVTFPSRFAVFYGKNVDSGEGTITPLLIDTMAKRENIRFKDLRPSLSMALVRNVRWALIDVIECASPQDYYKQVKIIADGWGIDLL